MKPTSRCPWRESLIFLCAFPALASVIPCIALAGGILNGRVNEVVVAPDGGVTFNVDGSYTDRPDCSLGNGYNRMLVEPDARGNRNVLAAVLTALHSGKGVTAVGTGQCNFAGGHEFLSYMHAWP